MTARFAMFAALVGLFAALLTPVQASAHSAECIDGMAEGHACSKIDLLGHLDLDELGTTSSGNGSDMWGWTDPVTGKEYALVGLNNGTAFVDITDPDHPLRLGNLPTHSENSLWRDVKTYGNYAFIVSEAANHGLQVFDLTRLRGVTNPPLTFSEDAWYDQFLKAHNIVINEESGFAYAVGSRQGPKKCAAGLHMIDIHDPLNPAFVGCFSDDGYTHDAQCINYDGPDTRYNGHEICLAANEDTLTIVDVTDKTNPIQLSRTSYSGYGYTHQGWLTADRRHFLLDDELDEINSGGNTRTYVFDVEDLTAPTLTFTHHGATLSSDHNLYIHDGYAYQSNYNSGLRILDLSNIDNGNLTESAFFDTYPPNDSPGFDGTWSNYPYYPSGVVAVSDITSGLYILQPHLCTPPAEADGLTAQPDGDNRIALAWNTSTTPDASYAVDRTQGGCNGSPTETIAEQLTQPTFNDASASGGVTYGYRVRAVAESGECTALAISCVEAATTGVCTAAPSFAGIASAVSAATPSCAIDLGWQTAQPFCGSAANYNVYRAEDPLFTPDPVTQIASGLTNLAFADTGVAFGTDYTYIVRSADIDNGNEDGNLVRLRARGNGPAGDGDWFSGAEIGDPILSGYGPPIGTVSGSGGTDLHAIGPGPNHVAWEIVDTYAHTGERSYWSGYNNLECLDIDSAPITLTDSSAASLAFWTRYGIEQGWDGGIVRISGDGGGTWQTITPNGGYPGVIDNQGANNNACGFAEGTGVFTGTDLDWSEQQFDLSAYAGQTVMLRWEFGTDTAQTGAGWWIDDISVHHAQVPGECTVASEFIFADGFESH